MMHDGKRAFRLAVMFYYVIAILFCGGGCLKHKQKGEYSPGLSMNRIRKDTELSFGSDAKLQQFFEKNPDYNPSWIAKISLQGQAAKMLEKELSKKQSYPLETRGALSAFVSWWTPAKTATKFQYITSYNAPVSVIISQAGEQFDAYIEWTSP